MFQCDCPPDNCAEKVRLYLAGQRSAGDELVVKFTPLVRSIVQRVLGPGRREEWDDACQAVFLRVFANLGRWEQRCPFCKWLAVVAARGGTRGGREAARGRLDRRRHMRSTLMAWIGAGQLALGSATVRAEAPDKETTRFFNGKNLDGWEGLNDYWSAKDGALVGDTG